MTKTRVVSVSARGRRERSMLFAKSRPTRLRAINMARSSPALHGLGFLVFVVFAVSLSASLETPLLLRRLYGTMRISANVTGRFG